MKATISALVPAAGCGARAGLNGNKILAPLHGQPLLWWTLCALLDSKALLEPAQLVELIIAARGEEWELIRPMLSSLPSSIKFVEGGATRQDSVCAAAKAAHGDFLMVHDAARPLVSPELIARVYDAAFKNGAAIAALPCPDTLKTTRRENGSIFIASTLDRESVYLAQTPQVFRRELLLQALKSAAAEGFKGTDCASLIERLKHPVAVVEGEARNFKVTFKEDLERAAREMKSEK